MSGDRRGWVKLYRSLLDSAFWQLPDGQRLVYITLLLLANHAEKSWVWQGKSFSARPGQLITSSENLAKAAGASRQTVRTALKNLERLGMLTNESTNQGMLITLKNWGLCQSGTNELTNELTNEQSVVTHQPTNQPADINKSTNKSTSESTNVKMFESHTNIGLQQTDGQQSTNELTSQSTSESPETNQQITTNKNDKNDLLNNRTTASPVDNLTTRMTTILGTTVAQHWLTDHRYGPDYCQAQLLALDRATGVRSARQWLLQALSNNFAKFQPPAPKPDPSCPHCGGRGAVTNFANNTTNPCTCIPRPASAVQEPPQQQAAAPDPSRRDTAALAARVAAARTP